MKPSASSITAPSLIWMMMMTVGLRLSVLGSLFHMKPVTFSGF